MRERPILFSAPMVRAILKGRKTQTRRVVKPQPEWQGKDDGASARFCHAWKGRELAGDAGRDWFLSQCPYGAPGDRLWVRETWAIRWHQGGWHVYFDADGEHARRDEVGAFPLGKGPAGRLRPSIHMPRWASRITLEVTGVRVERLQDISAADCLAEGIEPAHTGDANEETSLVRAAYATLWESINGAGSWDANPWVWVVEFRRVEVASD